MSESNSGAEPEEIELKVRNEQILAEQYDQHDNDEIDENKMDGKDKVESNGDKDEDNESNSTNDDKVEEQIFCCCKYNVAKTKENTDDMKVTLNEDVWALGFVIARKRKQLPCSFIRLLCCTYFTQCMILWVMIWSLSVSLNKNVVVQYKLESNGHCELKYTYYQNISNYTNVTEYENVTDIIESTEYEMIQSTDVYNYEKKENYTETEDATVVCNSINLIEEDAVTQTWDGVKTFDDDFVALRATSGNILVFPFASVFSFLLLSVYILSSLSNPVVMFVVAHKLTKVKIL